MSSRVKHKDVETKTPELLLPDATSTAETVINQAIDFCAARIRSRSHDDVLANLRKRNKAACGYMNYSIAKQIGEALGALDENVTAVYVMDYDATVEDVCFAGPQCFDIVHLIVQVDRKTKALESLLEALDHALALGYARLLGAEKQAHLLDAQLVDSTDIEGRVGYGAMLSSLYQRPLQVWER